MTSLNDPVHQREIEEKKRGSGKEPFRYLKEKERNEYGSKYASWVLIPFVGTTAGAACVFFFEK